MTARRSGRPCFALSVALALAAGCAAGVSAGGAAAQEGAVRVRGGEHAAYSRVVIDAPPGARFAWGVSGETLSLALPGLDRPLDLGAVAQGRGLSRVASAGVTADGLSLRLACACGARVSQLADGRIVIDVAEGAPRPAPPGAAAQPQAAQRVALAAAPAPVAAVAPEAAAPQAAAPEASAPQAAAPQASLPLSGAPLPSARPARASAAAPGVAPAAPETARADAASAPPQGAAETPQPSAAPRPAADETAGAATAEQTPAAATPAHAADAAPAAQPAAQARPATADPATPDPATPDPATPDPAMPDPVAALRAALENLPGAAQPPAQAAPEAAAADPGRARAATIEAARRRLLEQLTKAAEEGLLTLSDRAEPPTPPPLDPKAEGATPPAEQLRARNALEIANERAQLAPTPPPPLPENCLDAGHFAVTDWADPDAPFDEQVGPKRRALVGEFDAPMADAVFGYARLLTYFTFGREARAALAAFGDRITPPPALADMAMVVDREAPPADGALRKGVGCAGPHGLWAAAAAGLAGALDPAMIDVEALRQPLSVTPPHLRAALVTPIATAALEGGRLEAAEALAGVAARAEPPMPDGDAMLAVLLARLDAERGFVQRAEAALEEIGRQNSPAGIEAMIRLAEMRAARNVAPPKGLAENMEAVAFSLGETPEGRRLLAAAAHARAAGEGLAPALAALAALARRAGDKTGAMQAARDMLVDYEPAPEEAAAYAEAALAHWDLVGDAPEGDRARVAVAGRLAAMGIENLAETLLAPALARGDASARMAAADAATAAGAPDRALTHLDGVPGPAAARARAAALSALGDNAGAAEASRETGDAGLAARYAWLAGNWAAASAAGALDRRILAAWMSGATETPPELLAAAEGDPNLAALAGAFAPAPPPDDGSDLIGAAAQALEAAQKRRKLMGGLLGDG